MKKTILMAGAILAVGSVAHAQSTIADWTFETSQPTGAGPILPEIGSGAASGSHVGVTTYSSPSGNGSTHSYSSTLWAIGDYYQFQVSTAGFSSIGVSFDETSSNTGPGAFGLYYSTDNSTYTLFGNYSVGNAGWNPSTTSTTSSHSFDLSSITALNDDANVYFRLVDASTVSANGGTVGTGGTDRVDNFTVGVVPEPSVLSLFAVGGTALLGLRRRKS